MDEQTITLENNAICVAVRVRADGRAAVEYVLPAGAAPRPTGSPVFDDSPAPLFELRLRGEGPVSSPLSQEMRRRDVGGRVRD